jgi:hypothetical protein
MMYIAHGFLPPQFTDRATAHPIENFKEGTSREKQEITLNMHIAHPLRSLFDAFYSASNPACSEFNFTKEI